MSVHGRDSTALFDDGQGLNAGEGRAAEFCAVGVGHASLADRPRVVIRRFDVEIGSTSGQARGQEAVASCDLQHAAGFGVVQEVA